MNWRRKAKMQAVCGALPGGARLYRQIQRRFGNLGGDPFDRVPHHLRMVAALRDAGFDVAGRRGMEVGTGHVPTLPLLFHLAGAGEIVTVDLHRRLQWDLTAAAMAALVDAGDELTASYEGLVDTSGFSDRLADMRGFLGSPQEFFQHAHIRYAAPGDAAAMPDADGSYDLHFSTTVFEHIPPTGLNDILVEARRLLHPGGLACHIIDSSDHFAHGDPSITAVNFLRFTEAQWKKLAGNEFGYCNRLRAPQLLDLFTGAGFEIVAQAVDVDDGSLQAVKMGFPISEAFAEHTPEEISTIWLDVLARP